MEHWGYYLLPPPHPHCPGYTGLLVAIRDKPTLQHFDPEWIRLQTLRSSGAPEWTTLGLSSGPARSRRVYPGELMIGDRKGKQEEFVTFGASVESEGVPTETVYSIRSSAPILRLTRNLSTGPDQLAAEFGRLMAGVRANAISDDRLNWRLAEISPAALYVASLRSIFQQYEADASLRECFAILHDLLHEEQKWLQESGQWAQTPQNLSELIGKV